jgi:Subtilase family
MASAICPECHILLVESTTNSYANLATAEDEAATLKATEISDSWGGGETSARVAENSHYNHAGIPILVAAGDSGFGVEFPASAPTVIAVGGTNLKTAANSREWSETAWSGTGSGCSGLQSKPTWQTDSGCAKRTDNDVSAVADPETPLSVYDTYVYGGWLLVGGTSASAPIVAGVEALSSSTARAMGAEAFYKAGPAGHLFDVTEGSNGSCGGSYLCTAGQGYDGPTGWGTPNGGLGEGEFLLRNTNSAGSPDISFHYGLSTDSPISGDWNGDGRDTIGVYRPSNLSFYLRNTNSAGAPDYSFTYGLKAGTPVVGDWDGDGDETIGLYDANTGYWYLNQANDGSGAELEFNFGANAGGDIPVTGDWNGDGKTTIGVYRPSTRTFYLRNSNSSGSADYSFTYGLKVGAPVVADWNGDGGETIGLWDTETGWWYPNEANDGSGAEAEFNFGAKGDKPITGDWDADKDGTIGLFRP